MIDPNSLRRSTAALAVGGWLLGAGTLAQAQQPFVPTAPAVPAVAETPAPTPLAFSYQLGRIAQEENGVKSVFTLRATQPRDSKLVGQKIRFTIETITAQGTNTRQLALNTGKHKTVAQLCAALRDIFIKYQSARTKAVGSEVGKIGDLRYGGEIRFVAESAENLRYDMKTEDEEDHGTRLTASEVETLVALLGQPAATNNAQ